MSIDVRKINRPTLAAATFAIVTISGVTGWLVTREGDSGSEFVPMPIDAAPDAPPDAFVPDSPIDAPPVTEWTMITIYGPEATVGLNGADGVDTATIGGKLTVVSPWEQSGTVTVSTRTGSTIAATWASVTLATVTNVEDAKFCDVDQDGAMDVMAGGQGKRIRIWFGPTWSTTIEIDAATNVQQWMQLSCSAGKVWAGGRGGTVPPATFGYFTSATPRTASSWTYTSIAASDWLMSLIARDVDRDGDVDAVVTDRTHKQLAKGLYWYEARPGASFVAHEITDVDLNAEGETKFAEIVGSNTVITGFSSTTRSNTLYKNVTADNWATWTQTQIAPYPSNTGMYHAVATCDITGDGTADYVLTHSSSTGSMDGVVYVDGVTFASTSIDLAAGEKYDNVLCLDMDDDGDLDVLTSEQNVGLGVVWFRNPRVP